MASPYPKPVEMKLRDGNPGRRRLPEPLLISGRPRRGELDEPPAHLSEDAKDFWRDTVVRLVEVGLIDRVDMPALEMMAEQYARVRGAQRVIADVGYFAKGSTGQIKEHPAVKLEREATALFLKTAMQFGMTAVARTMLGMAEMHRRSLVAEMAEAFGPPELRPVGAVDR